MPKHSTSTDSKVLDRIRGHRRGWVFTPAHLADLGSRNAVASALKRFKADGGMRSGLPLLFDGIIGEVGYDSTSNTHDHNHFPKEWNLGHSGELMSEHWLSVDEIAAQLGENPDLNQYWIRRGSRPAHDLERHQNLHAIVAFPSYLGLRLALSAEIDRYRQTPQFLIRLHHRMVWKIFTSPKWNQRVGEA